MTASLRAMSRIGLPLLLLALVAASCSATEESSATAESTTTEGSVATTTTIPAETDRSVTSTTVPATGDTEPPVVVDGPPAPDFTLALADGTEFVLSEEQKPVYMVFWAEW